MLKPSFLRSQCQLLNNPTLSFPITKTICFPLCNSITIRLSNPPCFLSSIRRHQSITCIKKRKIQGGSQPSRKSMFKLASMAALSLQILPQPLNLLIAEFAERDGNEFLMEFLNVLGRGLRKKRQTSRKVSWLSCILLTSICGMGLVCWRISEFDLFLKVSCFCLAGLSMIQLWRKKAFKEWLLGFLLGIVLLSSRMGKEDVKFWVQRLRIPSSFAQIVIENRFRSNKRRRTAW